MTNKKVRKYMRQDYTLSRQQKRVKCQVFFEDVKASVASESEILSEEVPHLQQLAYTVRQSDGTYSRYDEAYFGSIKFRASQEGMMKIKQSMQGNENILRFIVLEAVEEDTRIGETLPGRRGGRRRGGEKRGGEKRGGKKKWRKKRREETRKSQRK